MTEKKKKGANVELQDFDFDEQDIARAQQERAEAAERVAQFNKDFKPSGSGFKDALAQVATSRDVKNMRHYDNVLDKAADRAATVRGQDAGLEVERGKIAVDTKRNELFGKQINGQLDLEKGELDINRAVLDMQQDRYNNVTKPSDRLSMAERAATARVGTAEAGFELSDDLFKETSKYLKDGKPVSTDPVAAPIPTTPSTLAEPEYVSRASIIGQYIKEGTGIPNPYNNLIPAIKQGRKVGRNLRNYLFEPTIKRRAKKSQ